MGAVDELDAHQGVLGVEDLRVDLFQFVPAQVVISVAGGSGKVALGDPVGLKGVQHLLRVGLGHLIHPVELLPQVGLGLSGQRPGLLTDL